MNFEIPPARERRVDAVFLACLYFVLVIARTASVAIAEIYDAKTERWTSTGALVDARTQFTMTLLGDGRVLVAGGARPFTSALSTAEIYDPTSGTWSEAGSMKTRRWNHRAVLLPNGDVLVVGGCDLLGELRNVELYSPGLRGSEK